MKLKVVGGNRLCGKLTVQGAKNSILPILAACVLLRGEVVLHNCPELSDVESAMKILEHLGVKCERNGDKIRVECGSVNCSCVPEHLMREMRSSIFFLGPILSRCGRAEITMPGGCELGPRPIDIHIAALKKLGAHIEDERGVLSCRVEKRLRGTQIDLWFPSVGATENTILAAVLAEGTTIITNAAREPEIVDLADFLNACGARIYGAGDSRIVIDGVKEMRSCEYTIMPDRIVAVTFLCATAITRGEINLKGVKEEHITSSLSHLEAAGCDIRVCGEELYLNCKNRPRSMNIIKTMPYPGFPTDAQAPMMSLAAVAEGTTMFVETIFENRYRHVCELMRMGADIKTEGKVAVVNGIERLKGADVTCTDLRGGAALLVAALSADGESNIYSIEHIDRGYQNIEKDMRALSLDVERIE